MGINWVITQLISREGCSNSDEHYRIYGKAVKQTAGKEVRDTSCCGSGAENQLNYAKRFTGLDIS
jgi:hypothetical protein